jgi:hypothetical protein
MGTPAQAYCGVCGVRCSVKRLGRGLQYIINCGKCGALIGFAPIESVIYNGEINLYDLLGMNEDSDDDDQGEES